jgi:steroid 5-alpha reductase family enzyme
MMRGKASKEGTIMLENVWIGLFLIPILLMAVTWVLAKRWNNYSVVDPVWAFCFTVNILYLFGVSSGWSIRRTILVTMVGFWSTRLGYFLTRRVLTHHPREDARYLVLRQEYGARFPIRFFLFFQAQAISVGLLCLPFLGSSQNASPSLAIFEWAGMVLFCFAVLGETVADYQMMQFKQNPQNKGQVMQQGLWRYSRHPNYFCESVIWWAYYLFALGTPGLGYTIFAPLTILFLLLKVTGIPLAEAQSLKSSAEAYREYQRKTSMFFPFFPKA